jgi:hypothetical protein
VSGVERCAECGFVYDDHPRDIVVAELASLGPRYRERLEPDDPGRLSALRRRPGPDVWSALEYAGHVRDVLLAQRERLFLALVEEGPSFAPIYRDRRAELARYAEEDPAVVTDELEMAAHLFARSLAGLDPAAWDRTCTYNYPEPVVRTVAWLAAHTLHEGEHHLADIDRGLAG